MPQDQWVKLTIEQHRSVATVQIGQAMVAAGIKTPSQSAIYHYPEMMTLIAEQPLLRNR